MKKKLLLSLFFCFIMQMMAGQVVFSKFKLQKNEPLGHFPGRKALDTKFKVTSDRDLKYVFIYWYLVNPVGDVISGFHSGIEREGQGDYYIKPNSMQCTGPFESGKTYSPWLPDAVTTGMKVTAFPYALGIMYMGENEMIKIPITKENINQFFPKLKWMEVNRNNPAL